MKRLNQSPLRGGLALAGIVAVAIMLSMLNSVTAAQRDAETEAARQRALAEVHMTYINVRSVADLFPTNR